MKKEDREAAIAMLWKKQKSEGGWSTRNMSDLLKWRGGNDPPPPAATWGEGVGQTAANGCPSLGVPATDKRIQKGIAWLKENQRITGRWWMHSLYRGNYNYITYISTAQALRALALCNELTTTTSQ